MRMTSCTGNVRGGFWGIWKKSVLLSLAVRRRRVTFASSQWPCGGCHTCWEVDGKANIESLCLSPYVEEPLNSKAIKSFVPELRSRQWFSCFGIPMFYVYMLWTLYVHFIYPYLVMVLLSGATTTGQIGTGNRSNKNVLCIPQSPNITEAEPSNCLLSHPEHMLGESYPSVEMQSVYSIATAVSFFKHALAPLPVSGFWEFLYVLNVFYFICFLFLISFCYKL